jgi:purine nucleosidase
MKPISILLDTDIGDDVDDALALAVALNSPEIELRGVTTVFRDAPRRALLARQLLQAFGRDVPVYAGASRPLLRSFETIPGGANLGKQFEALDTSLQSEESCHAVGAIINECRAAAERGERLTLVPIGPLTNIALALAIEPKIIEQARIVLMGGVWGEARAEWNILCDPEAAAMVFNSGADITMVGLDVTTKCVLSDEQVEQLGAAGTSRARLLYDLIKLWGHKVTLHDPLTLLTLFDDCVQFADRRIEVVLREDGYGHTRIAEGAPNCRVAVAVDAPRAIDLFMQRVLR